MHYRELSQKIDLTPVGLEPADNETRYFCTPVDADIFARAGVDGIHYVTLPAYGEMIFCVDPSGCHTPEVFAIAEDFDDLWRILLTCGDVMTLAEADNYCDETEFWTNVDAGLRSEEVQDVLKRLADLTGLSPRDRNSVYEPLLLLRDTIDYAKVQYSEEYWQLHGEVSTCPDCWEVYFHGSFWGHDGREQPCEERSFHTEFDWAGKHWQVPAVYVSGEGIVLDLCMAVETAEMMAFIDKWNEICEENDLWEQYEEQMQAENPLQLECFPCPVVNDRKLFAFGSCGIPWTPSLPEEERDDSPEADFVAEHYDLDPKKCWMIHRFSFPWTGGRRPIESIALEMTVQESNLPAALIECHEAGGVVEVSDPFTAILHTLTVTDCHAETVDIPERYEMEFPNQLYVLSCTMEPEPETADWFLRCVTESDEPRPRLCAETDNSRFYGIIGGADGPTAFCTSGGTEGNCHTFPSSLHFDLPAEMYWQLVWRYKPAEDGFFPFVK